MFRIGEQVGEGVVTTYPIDTGEGFVVKVEGPNLSCEIKSEPPNWEVIMTEIGLTENIDPSAVNLAGYFHT